MHDFVRDLGPAFFKLHFEKTELLVKRSLIADEFLRLIDISRFEEMLWLARLKSSAIQVSKNSETLPPDVVNSVDVVRTLPKWLKDGYSVTLNFAEEFCPKLSVCAREFGAQLDTVANLSIFLSPPGSAAFLPHFDAVDVFAVQIFGKKRWQVLADSASLPLEAGTHYDSSQQPPVRATYEVLAGNILYMPRGLSHSVCASDDAPSLHVSIATNRIRRNEALAEGIRTLAEGDREMRVGLRGHGLLATSQGAQVEISAHTIESARKALLGRRLSALPQLPGLLQRSFESEDKRPTRFRRRLGMPCEVYFCTSANAAAIALPGLLGRQSKKNQGLILFPPNLITPLEFIALSEFSFSAETLPGTASLTAKGVLLDRLYEEGLLEKSVNE